MSMEFSIVYQPLLLKWTDIMKLLDTSRKLFVYAGLFIASACLASIASADEYSKTYNFSRPVIKATGATDINGQDYYSVTLAGTDSDVSQPGSPILPVKVSRILIGNNENIVAVNVTKSDFIALSGNYLIDFAKESVPFEVSNIARPTEADSTIYGSDSYYPAEIFKTEGIGLLHGAAIAETAIYPVSYNPVTGKIGYYNSITVTITTEELNGAASPTEETVSRNLASDRAQILALVDNADDAETIMPLTSGAPAAFDRQYLIITTADMVSAFQQLADFRSSEQGGGFTTYIETIDNITSEYGGVDRAEQIRNFIIDCYENHGTTYVILGGDADGEQEQQLIPTRGTYVGKGSYTDYYIPTDLYFGNLDGTWNYDNDELWGETNDGVNGGDIDWYSEVFVGRIAADNATEASNHISKIIAHETTPSSYYKTLMIGEKLNSNPTWGGDRMDFLLGFMGDISYGKLYDRDSTDESWQDDEVISLINSDEYYWINHLGHSNNTSNMRINLTEAAALTNSKYYFFYTQGCYAGAFDNRNSSKNYIDSDTISEELTVGSSSSGAFGIISNSRYGWYNSSGTNTASNRLHKYFMKAIFEEGYSRAGEANQMSKVHSDAGRWERFETTLFGDPVSPIYNVQAACTEYTATNDQHVAAGRAHKESSGWWWSVTNTYYANGSEDNLGSTGTTTTTLAKTGDNYYTSGTCPSVEKTAPVINIDTVNARAFSVEISGTASDEDGDFFRVEIQIDNNEWIPVQGNKNWNTIIDGFTPGETHTVSARAYDVGGRYSEIAGPISFTNHGEAPVITDQSIYVQAAVISISANVTDVDGDIVGADVKIGDEDWKPASRECTGESCYLYHQEFGFSQGEYDIYIRAYDNEGNYTAEIYVDKAIIEEQHPPTITESHITREYYDGQYILKSTIADEDGDFYKCEFQLDGGEWQDCFLGWFYESYAVLGRADDLGLGEHTVQKRIIDTALHEAYSEVVTFEVVAKVAPEITALNALVNADLSLNIKGYARDIDGDVQRVEYSIDSEDNWHLAYDVEDGYAYGNFNWGTQSEILTKGNHTIYARAIDKTNQISEVFGPVEINVDDPVAPTCSIEGVRFIEGEDGSNDYYQIYGTVNDQNNNLQSVASKFDYNDYWGSSAYFENGNNGETTYEIDIWPQSGQRTVEVKAVDYTELEASCGSISFTVGNAPVIESINISVDGTSVTISGTATDADDNIESVKINVDNGSWITASGTTNWSITLIDQEAGDHIVKVIAVDSDELVSDELEGSFHIEEITYQCFTATNNEHESANRAHSETETTGYWWTQTTVTTWYALGSETNLGTSGSTVTTLVEYLDNPGYYVAEDCPVPPAAPVISNVNYSQPGTQSLTVTATVTDVNDDIDSVTLEYANGGVVATCSASGDIYTCSINNHEIGTFSFVVKAADATARTATSTAIEVVFTEQQDSPPSVDSYDHSVSGSTVTITGVASDVDGDLRSVVVIGLVAPLTCQSLNTSTGEFSCELTGLEAGDYTVNLVATDAAGNESAQAGPISFTIEDEGQCYTAVNNDHVAAGRAYVQYSVLVYATGSKDYLGMGTNTTSLQESSDGVWTKVNSCN